jgi:predicted metal-dependent enzyme (double-stranded beta helix superfamily)
MAHYSDSSSRLPVAPPLGAPRRATPRATTAARSEAEVEAAAAIERLRDALDAALAAVPDGEDPASTQCIGFARLMRAALAQAIAEDVLLTPAQCEGAANCYRRHLLIADPRGRYAAAALVWQPGQASPVHGHHTWCGYAVLDGVLEETQYAWDETADRARAVGTHARPAGAVSYVRAGLSAIHRLANASSRPAISLHVYGVAGEQITTHVNRLVTADLEAS